MATIEEEHAVSTETLGPSKPNAKESRPQEVEPWLAAAEAAAPKSPWRYGPASAESAICFHRALHHLLDGDLAAAEVPARRAAELELESGTGYWRARTLAAPAQPMS